MTLPPIPPPPQTATVARLESRRRAAAGCLAFAFSLLVSGCVIGAEKVRYSQPSLPGVPQRPQSSVGRMHVLPQVDLSVETMISRTKSLIVFPIPFYVGESQNSGKPTFSVFVSILAKEAGLVFLPQSLAYLPQEGPPQGPAAMTGPYDCDSQQSRPTAIVAPLPPFALTQGRCYTMLVTFAAPEPDPAANFGIAPGSLRTPSSSEALPVVRFSEDTRYDSVAIP